MKLEQQVRLNTFQMKRFTRKHLLVNLDIDPNNMAPFIFPNSYCGSVFFKCNSIISALHCSGSVSESVIHSFRCDAIASSSFVSLFLLETCLVSAENLRTMFEMWQFANICQLSFPIWEGTEVEQVSLNSLKIFQFSENYFFDSNCNSMLGSDNLCTNTSSAN